MSEKESIANNEYSSDYCPSQIKNPAHKKRTLAHIYGAKA
jgi:hypothetical protein